jgi:hypothetical protein
MLAAKPVKWSLAALSLAVAIFGPGERPLVNGAESEAMEELEAEVELETEAELETEVEPEAEIRARKPVPYPSIFIVLTSVGGGSHVHERVGVVGGDILVGPEFAFALDRYGGIHDLVLMPTFGWSGWRTLDEASRLRANTYTARLEFGYFNTKYKQGITVTAVGRLGAGRGPERGSYSLLYGVQPGVVWWPVERAVGLEFQSHFNNYEGVWRTDLRFVVTLNPIEVFDLLVSLAVLSAWAS